LEKIRGKVVGGEYENEFEVCNYRVSFSMHHLTMYSLDSSSTSCCNQPMTATSCTSLT
jgi:hypothetical protein